MKSIEKGPLDQCLSIRSNIIEIIIIAIVIAFGISIIVSSITIIDGYDPSNGIIFGVGVCIISLLYLICKNNTKNIQNTTINGFLIYSKKENKLINVSRYDFSESITTNLEAAFFENIAIKNIWDKEKLGFKYENRKLIQSKSNKLLCESIEYYILEKLSVHLATYFNKKQFNHEDLYTFQRNEIPDVLLSNRFLELFSKPIEDRPCFIDDIGNDNESNVETIAIFKNGAIYKKFDLVLPKGSKLRRNDKGDIEIITKKFNLTIDAKFEGFNQNLPPGFEKYYLGTEDFLDLESYQVEINIKIKFKLMYMLSIKNWQYYSWIDSFLHQLNTDICTNTYFEKISWNSISTILQCFETRNIITNNLDEDTTKNKLIEKIIYELCKDFLTNNEHINKEDLKYMKMYVKTRLQDIVISNNEIDTEYINTIIENYFYNNTEISRVI